MKWELWPESPRHGYHFPENLSIWTAAAGQVVIDLIPFPISFLRLQKETPSDVQLHMAAMRGDEVALLRVLDSGKVHVDCKDEVSYKKHLNQFMQLHDFQLYKVG